MYVCLQLIHVAVHRKQYSIVKQLYSNDNNKTLGLPKGSFGFFHTIVQKKWNKLFDQPSNSFSYISLHERYILLTIIIKVVVFFFNIQD